jgi:hypothetical protein
VCRRHESLKGQTHPNTQCNPFCLDLRKDAKSIENSNEKMMGSTRLSASQAESIGALKKESNGKPLWVPVRDARAVKRLVRERYLWLTMR